MHAMHEIELKFQIPDSALTAVEAELKARADHHRERLQAYYMDTPDRRLAQARMALRVRKEGRKWVQTLKAGGSNTMMRVEDNQPAKAVAKGQAAKADLSLHLNTPAQAPLQQALTWDAALDPQGSKLGLTELYRTDIWRQTVRLAVGTGTPHAGVIEVALDLGEIRADGLSVPVQELEIELIEGHPMAVIEAGRDWVDRHGLWLDTQTKAHRGDRLARRAAAPDTPQGGVSLKARPARLDTSATLDQAWRAGVESCLEQITANLSELATAPLDTSPSLYQLRVGLRRLRSLGSLLAGEDLPFPQEAMANAVDLFRKLGYWRDGDVLGWIPPMLTMLGGPDMPLPGGEAPADPVSLARSPEATHLCLDLLAALLAPPATSGPAMQLYRPVLQAQLKRWHQHALNLSKGFRNQTDEARHRVRKQCKRLRYAMDLYAPLLDKRPGRDTYLKQLKAVLSALGALQDEVSAAHRYREATAHDPRAWFGLGWLQARRGAHIEAARQELKIWRKTRSPW